MPEYPDVDTQLCLEARHITKECRDNKTHYKAWEDAVHMLRHVYDAQVFRRPGATVSLAIYVTDPEPARPDTQDSEGEVPAWLAEILHVVKGFADREHQGAAPTLVPWHAQNALFAVPADIAEAARIKPTRQEPSQDTEPHPTERDLTAAFDVLAAGQGNGDTETVGHPTSDPGDGRTQCPGCRRYVWPVIHSCPARPATEAKGQAGEDESRG